MRNLMFVLLLLSFTISADTQIAVTPTQHIRGGDHTYLTFPEWFLVHSPTEYAAYLKSELPSQFPYFSHIGQLWSSYAAMYDHIKDAYPFNSEYHTMIMVIGISTTAEYGIKGAYERSFGRLSELTRTNGMTDEDHVAHNEAQKYADFILVRPWYEFDYWGSLTNLWSNTSFFGRDMIRKLERKYFLTTEFLIKVFYAWVIETGAGASYDAPIHKTAVITDQDELMLLPRYRPFTNAAINAAASGVNFNKIAGNDGNIVISLWAAPDWSSESIGAKTLFTQPILTLPGQQRFVLEVPIAELAEVLRRISRASINLEHVYDF